MSLLQLIFDAASKKTVLATLEVDCTISERHQSSSEVTYNPVERGIAVTDHIQPRPKMFIIEGVFSDTPVNILGDLGNALFNGGAGASRITTALNFFTELNDNPSLIDIVTPIRSYKNMALQDVSIPRNKDTGQALHFTASFVEVKVVDTKETSLGSRLDKAKASKANLGKQNTKALSPSAEKKSGSIMKEYLNKKGVTQTGSGVR